MTNNKFKDLINEPNMGVHKDKSVPYESRATYSAPNLFLLDIHTEIKSASQGAHNDGTGGLGS